MTILSRQAGHSGPYHQNDEARHENRGELSHHPWGGPGPQLLRERNEDVVGPFPSLPRSQFVVLDDVADHWAVGSLTVRGSQSISERHHVRVDKNDDGDRDQ